MASRNSKGRRSSHTRMLVLGEIVRQPEATLVQVARRLRITPQAVSAHLQELEREQMVSHVDGRRVVTTAGVQHLEESLRASRRLIDDVLEAIAHVHVASAVARTRVRKGSTVGLSMEEGILVARQGFKSPSLGVAQSDAQPGHEVIVGNLSGIVDLRAGRIWAVRVPGPEEGGLARLNVAKTGGFLETQGVRPRRVAADGTAARLLVQELGWKTDFEFAAHRAAFHAAQLGLDVCLCVSGERWDDVMRDLDELNAQTRERIGVSVIDLLRRRA